MLACAVSRSQRSLRCPGFLGLCPLLEGLPPPPLLSPCRSACAHRSAAAAFVTRVDSEKAAALQPLLHKGPVKAADKAAAVACAADHIAGGRSVTVLAYEPLGSSDK